VAEEAASPSVVLAFLQPPVWRPFLKLLAGIQRLLTAKWCVPSGVKAAGVGGFHLVEMTRDLIAFSILGPGSLVQIFRTVV
jgi:hypothetical protein